METIFFALLITPLALYAIIFLTLIAGLYAKQPQKTFTSWPMVSVIVAARNEEHNIARCLDSLSRLDYPAEKLDVIISDGASEDRTPEIVLDYAKKFPFVRLHLADQNRAIKGKGNAIDQAVHIAKGEFIMMTDADCTVQPSWIKTTLKYFTDETGLVCGTTIPNARTPYSAMQALDWCHVLGTSGALVGIGLPVGGIGNNFNYRKEVYEETGGYEKIRFSVTEDFALFQAILKTKWKIAYPVLYEAHNSTEPMTTLAGLYEQKKRWIIGGLDANALQAALASVVAGAHLATLIAFFIVPIASAWMIFAAKCAIDLLFLITPLARLRRLQLLFVFPLFELYYYLFVLAVPFVMLFSRKVVWKGITYEAKSTAA
ncbi:MAG: glycosyltransferase [Rhizobacter sp.]|nr:glycosyltransferase [Chlorobiales bacterium]